MESLWRKALTDLNASVATLESHLQIMDESYHAIQRIDRAILNFDAKSIELLLQEICDHIVEIFELESCTIFLLGKDSTRNISGIGMPNENVAKAAKQEHSQLEESEKKRSFRFQRKVFLCIYRNDKPYLMLMFDGYTRRLETDRFIAFINTISSQLEILINRYHDDKILRTRNHLSRLLFEDNLDPKLSWDNIVRAILNYFPVWSVIEPKSKPLVQLFLYNDESEYLQLLSSSNTFRISTTNIGTSLRASPSYLLLNESITGLAIINNVEYLSINPRTHERSEIYKAYQEDISNSELVIPLRMNDKIFAGINFEHEEEDVFDNFFIDSALEISSTITPFVNALNKRREDTQRKEALVLNLFGGFLNRLSDTFQHKMAQPLTGITHWTADARFASDNGQQITSREIDMLEEYHNSIRLYVEEFAEMLPDFMHVDSTPVGMIFDQIAPNFESEDYDFTIEEFDRNLSIYSTSLINEHVFNIINNSVDAIDQRILEENLEKGFINVAVIRNASIDSRGTATGINFIDIVVEDNGGGVNEGTVSGVGDWGFSTRDTDERRRGFGIAAAREYVEMFGGELSWTNIKDGFRMVIRLQEFDERIHRRGAIGLPYAQGKD